MKFNELDLKKEVLKAIDELGFDTPTKIQDAIIPVILEGNDVLGRSETGTGKTLAFLSCVLSKIDMSKKQIKAIIIAPTRELAIQINEETKTLSKYTKTKSLCVYGSSSIENQIKELKKGVDVVIGTPGRILDLIRRKVLLINNLDFFVLDEADEMLNMGFIEDIETIFKEIKTEKQVLLFSATMPKEVMKLAEKYMDKNYKEISVITKVKTAKNVQQIYYLIEDKNRMEAMCRVMDKYNPSKCIIFTKTKRNADELMGHLSMKKYNVDIIHGDITQSSRIKTLERFKNGTFNYLLATDVAARGIHIDDIELIINYNLPQDNETYVHRIGRTGRVNKTGIAVTLVTKREERIISSIERHINTSLELHQLPTEHEIMEASYNKIINKISQKSTKTKNYFSEYLEKLDKEELKNICEILLENEMIENIGSNFKVDMNNVEQSKKRKDNKRSNKDCTRVFLTVGKLDNIDKKDLLTHLEKISGLPQGSMHSVEIMTKFTFMNVDNKHYDKFFKKCNNTDINGRKIRIEKAKK